MAGGACFLDFGELEEKETQNGVSYESFSDKINRTKALESSKKSLEEAKERAKAHWDKELAKPLGSKPAYGMIPKNVGCTYWSNSIQYSQVSVGLEANYDLKVTGGAPGNAKVNFSPAPYR
mmetsp:Transcript_9388/g.21485  ORF Transcript_9388/g.21485 Transcript_9388/m.21485 type:complete len:121 (-) Transcript_9388:80-442(-)